MALSGSDGSRWTPNKENGYSPPETKDNLRGNSLPSSQLEVDHSGTQPAISSSSTIPLPPNTTKTEASGIKAFGIWLPIVCGILCPFLDEGIIATAIPNITDAFKSLSHIGWYGSAYLMTMSAFQLIFGHLYANFSAKSVFLTSLILFEIGSILCAASPTSEILILGRAIAGVGAAGVCSGVFALFAIALPAKKLPTYTGAMGTVYGLSAVLGPIVGGVITNSYLTWRWCFWINLPLAVPPVIAVLFFIHSPPPPEPKESFISKMKKLDYLGITLLVPGISFLIIALEFGSSSHGFGAASTIGLLIASAILTISFGASQFWMSSEKALLPPRIVSNRVIWSCAVFTVFLESAFLTLVYYLPSWFQVIQEVSPSEAGIRYLALCIPFAISILGSGWLVSKFCYVQPFMLLGTVLVSLGCGLLSTLKPLSSLASWISFQIIAGIGIGASTETPAMAVQALVENEADVPLGIAAVLFCQNLGPPIALSIANSILVTGLTKDIPEAFPGLDAKTIISSGATELRDLVKPGDVKLLIEIYNSSLTKVFILAAAFAAGSVIGVLGFGLKRIRHAEVEQE